MRTRPADLNDSELVDCLVQGWRLDVVRVEYVPVGGGSHHWLAHDVAGRRHWVTVDDLDHKDFLGDARAEVFSALRCALDTALALREIGLQFVVAPRHSTSGEPVEPLGARYAVAVYPFVDGPSYRFEEPLPADKRVQLVDMLVRLHQATPAVDSSARPWRLQVPSRSGLEDALDNLDRPWVGGPFSEPARAAVAGRENAIRTLLEHFDRLTEDVAARSAELVITHGEPHPGNVISADGRLFLVDWDTVALAPPERDLWMITADAGPELMRYAEASGRQVDGAAIRLYRLRWLLDDIAIFTSWLRSAHTETADAQHAWRSLTRSLASPDLAGSTVEWSHKSRERLHGL